MERINYLITLFLLLISSPLWAENKPLNLAECFELAKNFHESIPLTVEDIKQVQARLTQTVGAITPQISFKFTETIQEKASRGGELETFTRQFRPELSLNLTQPIFHGLIEFYAIKKLKYEQREKAWLKKEAERALFFNVAESYYRLVFLERNIATTSHILSVLREQLAELVEWKNLGKVRDAEVIRQQATLALLDADLSKLKTERSVAYEVLGYLTGLNPQPKILIKSPLQEKIKPLAEYLNLFVNRSDVQAAALRAKMAESAVKMAKGEFFPKVDLEANYYPYRVGFLSNIDWDVSLNAEIPLLKLDNFGKLKEAKSKNFQEHLRKQQQERSAQNDIQQAYTQLMGSLNQLKKYQQAAYLAKKTYDLLKADVRLGQATQLEILQAQKQWLDASWQRDEAEIEAWQAYTLLKIHTGVFE